MRYKIERMYEKKKMPDPKNALASKSPSLSFAVLRCVSVSVCVLTCILYIYEVYSTVSERTNE